VSSFGHDRERQVKRKLEEDGWVVLRSPASKGDFDLIATRPEFHPSPHANTPPLAEVRIIEVKATAAGPYHSFGKADRRQILATAVRAGATAWLAYWPKRGSLQWIAAEDWPR
jgi:Holliday junction resolvase